MKAWLEKPNKVLLAFALASFFGIICLQRLPVFLYPKSNKPEYVATFRMSNMTSRDFLDQYGYRFQTALEQLDEIDYIEVSGYTLSLEFRASFDWGADPDRAKQNFITAFESFRGSLPYDIQRRSHYRKAQQNGGFFAAALFHPDMELSALHELVEPTILPKINKIRDLEEAFLYDPDASHVFVTVLPDKLAAHRLNVDEVRDFIEETLTNINAGGIRLSGARFEVVVENQASNFSDLVGLKLDGLGRPGLYLTDIAQVQMLPKRESEQVMRTNGLRSLVIFVRATDEGNLKTICESVVEIVKDAQRFWPEGTNYKVLVDPSEFIRAAIRNVILNIFLGGALAVLVFFVFVGSWRSTIFTAIEIPLAMIWAFILMYLFDVSLNLISLGGLALTAGMNIDASVVVVENILRHFSLSPVKSKADRIERIWQAVKEVRWPVITSTFSTCIVFLPLAQTSGIAYAILGDLAKAVVFSHAFSAVVALILVPIVRTKIPIENDKPVKKMVAFQNFFERLKTSYISIITNLVHSKKKALNFCLTVMVMGILVIAVSYPFIRKEIIALPLTDYIWMNIRANDFNTVSEMAGEVRRPEQVLLQKLGDDLIHTFVTVNSSNRASILMRIEDKNDSDRILEKISELLPSTTEMTFDAENFNPSQLPVPNPPDLRLLISGPERERLLVGDKIDFNLQALRSLQSVNTSVDRDTVLVLRPNTHYLSRVGSVQEGIERVGQITQALLKDQPMGFIQTDKGSHEVFLRFPPDIIKTPEDLAAFPWVVNDNVIPLSALMNVNWETSLYGLFQENGQEMTLIEARVTPKDKWRKHEILEEVKNQIAKVDIPRNINLIYEDPDKETNESLLGVLYALGLSVLLIFSILIAQFGKTKDSLMVMTAIPLGLVGVSFSLWLLNSTWSINSLLGAILLGGIAVNNSILLLSFFHIYQKEEGTSVPEAIIQSCETRFRPILITSLTTIIAMLPIALGLGEGAEVLRPLGIAVCGGMIVSTSLILFVIPSLLALTYNRCQVPNPGRRAARIGNLAP